MELDAITGIALSDRPEDFKSRKKFIMDFYSQWIVENPERHIFNKSLNSFIEVRYLSMNETSGHASLSDKSTLAVTFLTEILENAIRISEKSGRSGFPVGSILAKDGEILATGTSNGKELNDPTSHAETAAIRKLCSELGTRDLSGITLYSSMEPCLMCYGASYWAHIDRIVYAIRKSKLDRMHFENPIDLIELNETTNRKMEIVHLKELEDRALKVVSDWEEAIVTRDSVG